MFGIFVVWTVIMLSSFRRDDREVLFCASAHRGHCVISSSVLWEGLWLTGLDVSAGSALEVRGCCLYLRSEGSRIGWREELNWYSHGKGLSSFHREFHWTTCTALGLPTLRWPFGAVPLWGGSWALIPYPYSERLLEADQPWEGWGLGWGSSSVREAIPDSNQHPLDSVSLSCTRAWYETRTLKLPLRTRPYYGEIKEST